MKRIHSFILLRSAVVAVALWASSVIEAKSADARLIIKRSPTLGRDVSLTINIDGKLAGLLSWRRTFETHLAPGKHVVQAVPNGFRTPWKGSVEMSANQTYNYTAYETGGRISLEPKANSH